MYSFIFEKQSLSFFYFFLKNGRFPVENRTQIPRNFVFLGAFFPHFSFSMWSSLPNGEIRCSDCCSSIKSRNRFHFGVVVEVFKVFLTDFKRLWGRMVEMTWIHLFVAIEKQNFGFLALKRWEDRQISSSSPICAFFFFPRISSDLDGERRKSLDSAVRTGLRGIFFFANSRNLLVQWWSREEN